MKTSIELYSCCSCYVFRQEFGYFLILHEVCEMFFHTFALLYNQSNAILSPGFLSFVPFSGDYSVLLTSFSGYRKHLPNLVDVSWS